MERVPTADGPDVIQLTEAGRARAFTLANSLRVDAEEYRALVVITATGAQGLAIDGFSVLWLACRGLIEVVRDEHGSRRRATFRGRRMLERAHEEEGRLLERLREEAELQAGADLPKLDRLLGRLRGQGGRP
jgi:hypothetical protein